MSTISRLYVLPLVTSLLAGCTGMIPLYNLDYEPVEQGLTQAQVGHAVEAGAASVGWRTTVISPGRILATYAIRSHTVMVDITYTSGYYSIEYHNSIEMKIKCPQDVGNPRKPATVTNGDPGICGGGKLPAEIHGNYKEWIDGLNAAIKSAMRPV